MSDEAPGRAPKVAWDGTAYIMDPYLGLAHAQGSDARKAGDDLRHAPGNSDAALLSRRTRRAARMTTCQVDGCGKDLSSEKAYLQRYSVCDVHFKADVALVHGQEMRFCQQCNKFQDLQEFEGVRRSCAARSKDRNLRRRLQTTLQKGGPAEDLMMPAAHQLLATQPRQQQALQHQQQPPQQHLQPQQQQQQSRSPGQSGDPAGPGGAGSDASGGRAGSGDASMGGSAAVARRGQEAAGSGGSDYSLDDPGGLDAPAGMGRGVGRPNGVAAVGARLPTGLFEAGLPSQHQNRHQPTGSGANGRGASSGNPDGGVREAPGGGRAGSWHSMEHVGQSYDADAGMPATLAAALARRGGIGAADAAGTGASVLMDVEDTLLGDASAYGAHAGRFQAAGGPATSGMTLDAGGAGGADRAHEAMDMLRKLGTGGGGGGGGGGSAGAASWGAPLPLALQDLFDGVRPQNLQQQQAAASQLLQQQHHHQHHHQAAGQQQQQQQQQQHHHQHQHQAAGQQRTLHGSSMGSLLGSTWGSGMATVRQPSLGAEGSSLAAGSQQLTLGGGLSDDSTAAALLEQLQGTMSGAGVRSVLAAVREELSGVGLLGAQGDQRGGNPGVLGSSLRAADSDLEGQRGGGALAGAAGRALLAAQNHQAQAQSSLLPQSASVQRHDDLLAMVKERRAALIRQQLLQQQHRQHQQQQQQQQQRQQAQAHELLHPTEVAVLRTAGFKEGSITQGGLTAAEQLRLLEVGAGGAIPPGGGGAMATGLDEFSDVVNPHMLGTRGGGVTGGGGGGGGGVSSALDAHGSLAGRLLGAAGGMGGGGGGGSSGLSPFTSQIPLGSSRKQTSLDPGLDTLQLLEQYAHSGGGGARLGGGGGGGGGGSGHSLDAIIGGHVGRSLQQNTISGRGSGDDGAGGGAFVRYDSAEATGGGSFASQGAGDHGGNGGAAAAEGGAGIGLGGSSSRLISVLFPGGAGREDALAARVCLKLFSCVPEDLPGDMLMRLRRWAAVAESDVLQIFMRPGCVHLIMNVRLSSGGAASLERYVLGGGDLGTAVSALRRAFDSSGLLRGRRVVVQAGEGPRCAFVYDGTAGGAAHWVAETDVARAPSVMKMQPAVVPCGVPVVVVLTGRNLLRPGVRFYARCGSRSHELRPLSPQHGPTADGAWACAPPSGGDVGLRGAPSPMPGLPIQLPSPDVRPKEAGAAMREAVSPAHWSGASAAGDDGPAPSESGGCLSSWASPVSVRTPERPMCRDGVPVGATDSPDSLRTGQWREAMQGEQGPVEQTSADGPECAPTLPSPAPARAAPCDWVCGRETVLESVRVHLPPLAQHGLLAVEAVSPDVEVMGAWVAGVACHDPSTAAELNGWLRCSADAAGGQWLLKELGLLLDYDAMLPSLLHTPVALLAAAADTPALFASPIGGALAAAENGPPAAGHVPARIGHQRALQHKLSQQQHQLSQQQHQQHQHQHQHQQQSQQQQLLLRLPQVGPRVMAMFTNPPEVAADRGSMSAAVAAAGVVALTAVPLGAAAGSSSELPPIVTSRPDGSLELRLLASETQGRAPGGASRQQLAGQATTAGAGGSGAATPAWQGSGRVGAARPGPLSSPLMDLSPDTSTGAPRTTHQHQQQQQQRRAALSDDTRVPDAPGRLLGQSMRRLLAHPLLHPGCRRAMLVAGSRLLAFSVAAGLRHLASGLLQWLMLLEAPRLGVGAGHPAGLAAAELGEPCMSLTVRDVFERVVLRAARATMRGPATTAAGLGVGPGLELGRGRGLMAEPLTDDSSLGSSTSSARSSIRNLSNGLSLLHLAVASCSVPMVMQVLDWAEEYGRPWALDERSWASNVTPLHLAAGVAARRGDGGEIARLLLALGPEVQDSWLEARDSEGLTPADVANAAGQGHLTYYCLYGEEVMLNNAELRAPHPALKAATQPQLSPPQSSSLTSSFSSSSATLMLIGAAPEACSAASSGCCDGVSAPLEKDDAGDIDNVVGDGPVGVRPDVSLELGTSRQKGPVGLHLLLGALLVLVLAAMLQF